jgi:hypothetical protein
MPEKQREIIETSNYAAQHQIVAESYKLVKWRF